MSVVLFEAGRGGAAGWCHLEGKLERGGTYADGFKDGGQPREIRHAVPQRLDGGLEEVERRAERSDAVVVGRDVLGRHVCGRALAGVRGIEVEGVAGLFEGCGGRGGWVGSSCWRMRRGPAEVRVCFLDLDAYDGRSWSCEVGPTRR